DGLTALAIVEHDRIDPRDAILALALLDYAAGAVGTNADDAFKKATALAEPNMSNLISEYRSRSKDERDLREFGFTVVETKAGSGFIGWEFHKYQPTYPLDQIGLALVEALERDKYEPTSIMLASELPDFWLSSVDDAALKRALASVRAALSIHA